MTLKTLRKMKKVFLPVIGLSIPFMLDEKHSRVNDKYENTLIIYLRNKDLGRTASGVHK